MSKLTGGLFSRPSGKNSGLVFSSARTSRGKRATARNYVIPTQPGTERQIFQKNKIAALSGIYRQLPEQIKMDLRKIVGYPSAWSAMVALFSPLLQIPALMHIGERRVQMGGLWLPRFIDVSSPGLPDNFTFEWSGEIGSSGSSADDLFTFFGVQNNNTVQANAERGVAAFVDVAVRSELGCEGVWPFPRNNVIVFGYFRSQDTGLLSTAVLKDQ